VGVSEDAFRPVCEIRAFFMLTAAQSLASPLRLDATDRRAPLTADGVIGHRVSLLFSQPFFQATDDALLSRRLRGSRGTGVSRRKGLLGVGKLSDPARAIRDGQHILELLIACWQRFCAGH
jgi:hypothetical protein